MTKVMHSSHPRGLDHRKTFEDIIDAQPDFNIILPGRSPVQYRQGCFGSALDQTYVDENHDEQAEPIRLMTQQYEEMQRAQTARRLEQNRTDHARRLSTPSTIAEQAHQAGVRFAPTPHSSVPSHRQVHPYDPDARDTTQTRVAAQHYIGTPRAAVAQTNPYMERRYETRCADTHGQFESRMQNIAFSEKLKQQEARGIYKNALSRLHGLLQQNISPGLRDSIKNAIKRAYKIYNVG